MKGKKWKMFVKIKLPVFSLGEIEILRVYSFHWQGEKFHKNVKKTMFFVEIMRTEVLNRFYFG